MISITVLVAVAVAVVVVVAVGVGAVAVVVDDVDDVVLVVVGDGKPSKPIIAAKK